MQSSLCCRACLAPLQQEDGHDLCPPCLGVEHLQEGLTENACSNCSILPRPVRLDRLAALEQPRQPGKETGQFPAAQPSGFKRPAATLPSVGPRKRTRKGSTNLSGRVDLLTSELAQMRALLQTIRPQTSDNDNVFRGTEHDLASVSDEDALSVAASDTLFREDSVELDSRVSESDSRASSYSQGDVEDRNSASVIRAALVHLQLDTPQRTAATGSAFFRRQGATPTLVVPPCQEYVKELHACWTDTKALSRLTSDGRAVASMQDAPQFGLGHMPSVEPAMASLIVSPEEALRANPRCPTPQCRITDELLCRAYDMGARMGRMGNSLSHFLLGLSASLEACKVDTATQSLSDASLHTFALMSKELGRLLSALTQARRQVWLAQSPLTEPCRRTLRSLPVVPGQLFGGAALEALERTAQASRTTHQLGGLRRQPRQRAVAQVATQRGPYGPQQGAGRPRPRARLSSEHRGVSGAQAARTQRSVESNQRTSRPFRGQRVRR